MHTTHLVEDAHRMASGGKRRLLGITGPPGSGKSSLAELLLQELGERAVLVPMDGFHLAEAELRRLGRLERKGARDTFDGYGYVALLRRLAAPRPGETVYAPAFDRALEEPVAGSVPVPPDTPLVLTEGNYLLDTEQPWAQVRPLLDEAWYVDLDGGERRRRLVARHRSFGKSQREAERFVAASDEANARLVAGTRPRADRHITLDTE